MGSYLIRAEPPAPADLIVVLAGDFTGSRILKAGELVRQGYAPRALVSGPADLYGLYESDLAIRFAGTRGYSETNFVALPNHSKSTLEEAHDVINDLRRRGAHRIDLVTSNFHTRRAGGIYHLLASDLEIHVIAASDKSFEPDRWWKTREGRKIFAIEWMKTAASWFGL